MLQNNDIAKLLLRLSLGGLLLFHGIHKMIYGLKHIQSLLSSASLPEFLSYGVFGAELIAPIFLILGLYARVASVVVMVHMLMAIYLTYGFTFELSSAGGLVYEKTLLFFIFALLVFLFGSGKYSVNSK